MTKVTSVSPVSAAMHIGLSAGLVGLVLGVIYAIGGLFFDMSMGGMNRGTAMAFGATIGMPIYLAISGGIGAAIGALVYNFVARRLGGIEVSLTD